MFLSLAFQWRDDVLELKWTFWDWKELVLYTRAQTGDFRDCKKGDAVTCGDHRSQWDSKDICACEMWF